MWSVRVTGKHRDRAAQSLGAAYRTGAISTATFELRLEGAFRARTRHQLQSVLADLPGLAGLAIRLRALALGAGPAGPALGTATTLRLPDAPRLLVGRAPACGFVLDDDSVSRRHASLRREGDRWLVCDLGSTNGTWLNGVRVERAEVRPGDVLCFGQQATRLA